MATPVAGVCDPRFSAVQAAFEANFTERGEVGAAVCVIHRGESVVDLVGGWVDEARSRLWTHDTICGFYSAGKALLALLVLRCIDEGALALDDPVVAVWPEFATGGKEGATVRHALSHLAGIPAILEPLSDDDLFDWERMTAALAHTPAWSPPGERFVYHTNTFGHLVGEILRRASGAAPGAALRELAEPLGADVWFGVPASEQQRCADIIWAPRNAMPDLDRSALHGDALMNLLAHFNPPGYSSVGVVNTPAWRRAQIGSTSGHGSAKGLARFYAALVQPGRLLSPDLLREATSARVTAACPILGETVTYGLGFTPTTSRRPLGPNRRSFGHFGTGGAVGLADPDEDLAFGYVMNHVVPRWQSSRNRALIDAVFDSVAR